MKTNPHNIDRSGFRKGEHVGYGPNRLGNHDVWRIAKGGGYYEATARETGERITAPTLNGISLKLTPKQNPMVKTNYQTIDKHGNIWNHNAATGQQTMIHQETEESGRAARAELKKFAAERKAAAMSFDAEFLKLTPKQNPMVKGTQLSADQQRQAKAMYVHRFTKEHVPTWAKQPRPDGSAYEPHFASDDEWLANSEFAVTNSGKFDARHRYHISHPTWPDRKKNPPRSAAADEHASRELELFIDNDADLYRQQTVPIMKNLVRKIKAGKYDSFKAVKLWGYLMEAGAKKYAKEFSTGTDWNVLFSKATRDATALRYARQFEINLANGEYNEHIGAQARRLTQAERQPLKHLAHGRYPSVYVTELESV